MEAFKLTPEYIDWELDGAQGAAYRNWAVENKAGFWGSTPKRKTDGYVRQEYLKLMQQYYDSIKK